MMTSSYVNGVEFGEVQRLEGVDRGPNVLAVRAALHHFQLPHARHVRQT